MTLKQKVRQYHAAQQKLRQLEAEIKREASQVYRAEGHLVTPRFERIIERFAA